MGRLGSTSAVDGSLPTDNFMFMSSGREAATADAKHNRNLTPDFSVVRAHPAGSHHGPASACRMFPVFKAGTKT